VLWENLEQIDLELPAFLGDSQAPRVAVVRLDPLQEFEPRLKSRMLQGVIRTPELDDMYPHLSDEALAEARGVFDEVHLYTAADRDYAMAVLKATGLRYAFDEVYTVGEVYAGTQVLPVNARTRWALIDNDEGIAMSKISAVSGPAGVRIAEAMRTHWVFVPDFAPKNRRAAEREDATVLFGAVDDAAWRTR
jgi:hypothetical protein